MRLKKIAAVIVTYNRSELLKECINGLLRSTRRLDAIYVIDNASTDNTEIVCKDFKSIEVFNYIKLNANTGGAGGFAAGLKKAFEDGYDWFWLMDDDVEPYENALENLIKYENKGECIHGIRTRLNGEIFNWGAHFDEKLIRIERLNCQLEMKKNGFVIMNNGCFEGMLISRDVVKKIGYPIEDLFITWDDTYYGFLASKVTSVIYVNVLSLKRKREIDSIESNLFGNRLSLSDIANYYHNRNKFYLAKYLKVNFKIFIIFSLFDLILSSAKDFVLFRSFSRVRRGIRGYVDGVVWYFND